MTTKTQNNENDNKVTNKLAIITGASQGIGKSIALKLAELGYNLALISRNHQRLNVVRDEILNKYSCKVITAAADISDPNQIRQAIQEVISQFNTIDILVNAAGIAKMGTSEINPSDFEALIRVNLIGTYYVIHECVPHLKKQKFGHIVNIGSTSGRTALINLGAYAASKFGLVGYNEALCKELAEFNIKVTVINSGMVNTEMTKGSAIADDEKIQPEDIAEAVAFLLKLSRKTIVKEIIMQCEKRI